MSKLTVENLPDGEYKGKVVLVRVDFNVPLKEGENETKIIANDARIRLSKPTLDYLVARDAKVVLISHLGRPDGKVVEIMSLAPVAKYMGVPFVPAFVGEQVTEAVRGMQNGDTLLLENVRFSPLEEQNSMEFAQQLLASTGASIYVNDAFSASHRAHTTTSALPKLLLSQQTTAKGFASTTHVLAGLLFRDELACFTRLLTKPAKPFAAVVGGAKVSTKLTLLKSLLNKVDKLLIGGAMVFTFYRVLGFETGRSLVEESLISTCDELMKAAEQRGVQLILACDVQIGENFPPFQEDVSTCDQNDIPSTHMGLDIGPKTIDLFAKSLEGCQTVIWNGPMGCFEHPPFDKGTNAMIDLIASMTSGNVTTVVCGGDTVSAVETNGNVTFTHISTSGGASLEFLEGKELPGIFALQDAPAPTIAVATSYDTTIKRPLHSDTMGGTGMSTNMKGMGMDSIEEKDPNVMMQEGESATAVSSSSSSSSTEKKQCI